MKQGRAGGRWGAALRSCLVLLVVLLALFPAFAGVGYLWSGTAGIWSAAIAGVVCWAGATAALVLVAAAPGGEGAVSAILLGTIFRMGLPLVAGFLLHHANGELARAGVFGMILCYYLVALLVETVLSVRLISSNKSVAKA